jgi:hypothetical protein
VDMTAVNGAKCVLEVWPKFGILTDLRCNWIIGSRQKDISGVKWICGKDTEHVSEIAMIVSDCHSSDTDVQEYCKLFLKGDIL